MASARDILHDPTVPIKRQKVFNRGGSITNVERQMVAQFVADQPREITTSQVTALTKVLRRSRDAVKQLINDAREDLASSIGEYVAMHKKVMNAAYENGDPKSLEVASRASQWGMENIAIEGVRVVDKAKSEDTGIRIQVGVLIGGVNDPSKVVREAKVVALPDPPPSDTFSRSTETVSPPPFFLKGVGGTSEPDNEGGGSVDMDIEDFEGDESL